MLDIGYSDGLGVNYVYLNDIVLCGLKKWDGLGSDRRCLWLAYCRTQFIMPAY